MSRKEWSVSELQNLLAMIMDGFKVTDMMQAFNCTKKQIQVAVAKHFDSSVIYIRMKYKIRVIK
tara:strand:+ start:234 stop:425 length:192 start_codon:yes stop_codon:yes gene_type:complete